MSSNLSRDTGMIESTLNEKDAHKLLGEEVLRSRFSLLQAAMQVTPDQVKWWKLRNLANERAEFLLFTKFSELAKISLPSPNVTSIYKIESGKFRGFQLGNPDVAPYETHVDVFDEADRHYEFDVTGAKGHGVVLTQMEINAMIASIQPASAR